MELEKWIVKFKQAHSREEIFALLDEFRHLEWTDEQRATISRLYIRLLEKVKSNRIPAVPVVTTSAPQADEEVWYEKM